MPTSDRPGSSSEDDVSSASATLPAPALSRPTPEPKGTFLDFFMGINANKTIQAKYILKMVGELHTGGAKKVGIICSASYQQAEQIHAAYSKNERCTRIKGQGQAAVMAEVERLLQTDEYGPLQSVFQILPITTCYKQDGSVTVQDSWIDNDLTSLASFIFPAENWVLGWYNRVLGSEHSIQYAIGAGNSKLTIEQSNRIQLYLEGLSNKLVATTIDRESDDLLSPQQWQDYVSKKTAVSKSEPPHRLNSFGKAAVGIALLNVIVATASAATLLGVPAASIAWKLAFVIQAIPFGAHIALAATCGFIAFVALGCVVREVAHGGGIFSRRSFRQPPLAVSRDSLAIRT